MSKKNIVSFEQVTKLYKTTSSAETIRAVSEVSIKAKYGETLAIVGESGSGKSTLVRMLMKLESPTAGLIKLDEDGITRNIEEISDRNFYRRVQMVFQDPYASLNGRKRVWEIVSTGPTAVGLIKNRAEQRAVAEKALTLVGLAASYLDAFPNSLSGGQRQRVSIARALAVEPEILVLDEPLSALDVSVQAQIVNLLLELQKRLKLTYLFISHDLAVVRHIADKVAVMHTGQLVEYGSVEEVIDCPKHPYTLSLVGTSFAVRPERSKTGEQGAGPTSLSLRDIA